MDPVSSSSTKKLLLSMHCRIKKWVKNQDLDTIFWIKTLKFFDADPGSGMEKIRIRDGKNSDPGWKKFGSGINILDPQH